MLLLLLLLLHRLSALSSSPSPWLPVLASLLPSMATLICMPAKGNKPRRRIIYYRNDEIVAMMLARLTQTTLHACMRCDILIEPCQYLSTLSYVYIYII
ncbi:hypothetical protein BS78_01G490200 [Paspalum vaginatum]|nr:hypothetical protein BS78_01G490200 [Paspalum vaginatum]